MNKKIWFVILAAVVVLAGIVYFNQGNNSDNTAVPYGSENNSQPSTQGKQGTSGAKSTSGAWTAPKTYTVNLTDTGPQPSILDISTGDTVKFVNTGTRPYWVASDPHPTHELCPGFDAVHGLVHGEAWSHTFKFSAPKTCFYHNHVDITTSWYKGTINIK